MRDGDLAVAAVAAGMLLVNAQGDIQDARSTARDSAVLAALDQAAAGLRAAHCTMLHLQALPAARQTTERYEDLLDHLDQVCAAIADARTLNNES